MIQEKNCYSCAMYMVCDDKYKSDWKIATKERECWTDEGEDDEDETRN